MKRKLSSLIFITTLFMTIIFQSLSVRATTVGNQSTVNSNMNLNLESISYVTSIGAWHYAEDPLSGWIINYNDWANSFTIADSDIQNYFSGSSKNFLYGYSKTFDLSSDVQKFIEVYGKDKLGMNISVGKTGSVVGDKISYTLTNSTITISFKPILNYVRYDMWQTLNPNVTNSMKRKGVYTPQVTSGYGKNYLSIGDGSSAILLDPDAVSNAYVSGDGLYTKGYYTNWGIFSNGGCNGVYWDFPINIDFYGLDIYTSIPEVSGSNVFIDGATNWVKSGTPFMIYHKGTASNIDNIVKPTLNVLDFSSTNGNDSASVISTLYSGADSGITGNSSDDSVINYLGSSGTRIDTGKGLASSYNLQIFGSKDFYLKGNSRLVNYDSSYNSYGIWRMSPWSEGKVIKSDDKAPESNSIKIDDVYVNDKVEFNLDVLDKRSDGSIGSGVKPSFDVGLIALDKDGNEIGTEQVLKNVNNKHDGTLYQLSFNLSDSGSAFLGKFRTKVYGTDNVGNYGLINKIDLTKDFTIQAKIIRTLEPHEPKFRGGEEGILQITVTGYVEKVTVDFSRDILAIDKTLNKSFDLTPKEEDSIEYKFFIPLNTPKAEYPLRVTAVKEGREKYCNLEFSVQGSILDSLRTRIVYN